MLYAYKDTPQAHAINAMVNTAAHIQNKCNAFGVDNLISQDLMDVLHLPATYAIREIGSTDLKGKLTAIRLWTLLPEQGPVPLKALPKAGKMAHT